MDKYLVGIVYHDPKLWKEWEAGKTEDYESSTGVFIIANSEEEAISWGEEIASKFFVKTNPDEQKEWKSFGYDCWIEHDWENSGWGHCLDFFQCVHVGEMPQIELMGTDAYIEWQKNK